MEYKCRHCDKSFGSNRSKGVHESTCKLNKSVKPRNYVRTDDYLERMRTSNKLRWTEEERKRKSERMLQAVKDNPDSYSKNNVSGRVKIYEVCSSSGPIKLKENGN